MMEKAIKKDLADAMRETIMTARENSIYNDKGRVFLDGAASGYGAAVNVDGLLIDADGNVMTEKHADYNTIIEKAKQLARDQSSIGADLLGP